MDAKIKTIGKSNHNGSERKNCKGRAVLKKSNDRNVDNKEIRSIMPLIIPTTNRIRSHHLFFGLSLFSEGFLVNSNPAIDIKIIKIGAMNSLVINQSDDELICDEV
jgi:hypothetical protein